MLNQNNKIIFTVLLTVLVVSASAAYFNIGVQYFSESNYDYYVSMNNNILNFDFNMKFFQDKLSFSVVTPHIFISHIEFGYEIFKNLGYSLQDGSFYAGLVEELEIKPVRLKVSAQIDKDMTFSFNGVVGIEF